MSVSIYNVPNWAATTVYSEFDIVKNGNYFYYAKTNHTSGASFDDTNWNGRGNLNNLDKPKFAWQASYSSPVDIQMENLEIKFGDGYSQRLNRNINPDLLMFDLTFDKIKLEKTAAILHFLHQRKGVESFIWTPYQPYDSPRLFVCKQFKPNPNFFNNFTISARFEEIAGD